MTDTISSDAIGKVRESFANLKAMPTYEQKIVQPRDGVFARFQPVFTPEHVTEITEDEFKPFLLDSNNHHWSGLHRQGGRLCSDMGRLRKTLAHLLDESLPIHERLDKVVGSIKGLGKAIATAILFVAYPDRYGIWNRTSESGMIKLGCWPNFQRGESFGRQYVRVNQILLQLRDDLKTDLWTLDYVWWLAITGREFQTRQSMDDVPTVVDDPEIASEQCFALERHLHEFLRDNWSHLDIGREWAIHAEVGDDEAGYEYVCPVGRIDILAKHRKQAKWLVVELKRNLSSDQAVGQALRYMGWVARHLAQPGEEVRGLIISHDADDSIQYAVSAVPAIDLRLYEVEFRLKKPGEKAVGNG